MLVTSPCSKRHWRSIPVNATESHKWGGQFWLITHACDINWEVTRQSPTHPMPPMQGAITYEPFWKVLYQKSFLLVCTCKEQFAWGHQLIKGSVEKPHIYLTSQSKFQPVCHCVPSFSSLRKSFCHKECLLCHGTGYAGLVTGLLRPGQSPRRPKHQASNQNCWINPLLPIPCCLWSMPPSLPDDYSRPPAPVSQPHSHSPQSDFF